MTKLLKQAVTMVRDLPEDLQDTAARQLMQYVDELSTLDDGAAITVDRDVRSVECTKLPI
jgi:hypothetical protein